MHYIHQYLVILHIIVGSAALVLFWLPMVARKGSKNHLFYGKIYVWSMYIVSITGLITSIMVLIDPIGIRHPGEFFEPARAYSLAAEHRLSSLFLLMLSLLVFMNVRQAVAVLRAKADRASLKTWYNLATAGILAITGGIVAFLGWNNGRILLTIFGIISLIVAISFLRYLFKKEIKQREWIIEHLGAIIGSGIGAYTAFFAFGGRYFLASILPGQLQIIPWITPAVVGLFLTFIFTKKFRKQFKVV